MAARASIVTRLVELGRLEEARATLEALAADRPDFARTLSEYERVEHLGGVSSMQRRRRLAEIWSPVDLAEWELVKARR